MRTSLVLTALALASCYNPDIPNGGFTCSMANPTCPDGFTCVGGSCTKPVGGGGGSCVPSAVNIPKMGPKYMGVKTDPGLGDATKCSDAGLEPNDGVSCNPLVFTPPPDAPTQKIINVAICPTGPNPLTSSHDVDFYKIDNSTGPSSLSLVAQIFYDIGFGDLDVAIYDSGMHLLAADGTEVSNGCVAAQVGQGVYYVVVAGANNVDSNNYQLQIRSYSSAHTCSNTGGSPDMAGP